MDNKNTPKPKPARKETAPAPAPVEVEVEVEVPAVEVEEEVVALEEVATVVAPASTAPTSEFHVVGGGSVDVVYVSKIVFKNVYQKKSLSVHHLQRRLVEWGFMDAFADKDGYFGDLTQKSVIEFQTKVGLEPTGIADFETLTRLFENDSNVIVAP